MRQRLYEGDHQSHHHEVDGTLGEDTHTKVGKLGYCKPHQMSRVCLYVSGISSVQLTFERSHGDVCTLYLLRLTLGLKLPLEVKLTKRVCFRNQLSTIYATLSYAKHEAHLVLNNTETYMLPNCYFFRGFTAICTCTRGFHNDRNGGCC